MPKNKKPFINKKKAQTFSLVHRSQRDPLQADDEAGKMVLVPGEGAGDQETAAMYGVQFEDEYDYMQHMKVRGEGELILADDPSQPPSQHQSGEAGGEEKISFGSLLLPAGALPSKYEEDVGMLNKGVLPRGPQPDWDPDILEALDDGVDFDDPDIALDDDFMVLANGKDMVLAQGKGRANSDKEGGSMPGVEGGWETCSDDDDDSGSEFSGVDSDFDLNASDLEDFNEMETGTRFTNYSMTSSVIRRTEELKLLDDKFEKIMEEYGEGEIGPCDHEEMAGQLVEGSDIFKQTVGQFEAEIRKHALEELDDEDGGGEQVIVVEDAESSEEESEEKLFSQFKTEPKAEWDCESIVSTYSNIYNHPKLITNEPRKSKITLNKQGLPEGVFKKKQDKDQPMETTDDAEDAAEIINLNNNRSRGECAEEKRARKQAVKQLKRGRREEKKQNRELFKHEQANQERVLEQRQAQQQVIKL